MAADDGDTFLVAGCPAAGGRVKIEGAAGLLQNCAVQNQLGGDHAGCVGGAVGQFSVLIGGKLILLRQKDV